MALTGGSMGSAIIASVLRTPGRSAVDWSRVRVWWGDERYLPAGDPDRNDTQNDEAGLSALGLDPAKVHRVAGPDVSESAEASAEAYGQTIREHGQKAWDVVLFGVGPDGHVASLFPHHPAQRVTDAIAVAVHDSPKPPPDRVSLTFECFERSHEVWFLVVRSRQGRGGRGRARSRSGPLGRPGGRPRGHATRRCGSSTPTRPRTSTDRRPRQDVSRRRTAYAARTASTRRRAREDLPGPSSSGRPVG